MRFSIVTPSFRQLEWLRLCVASVADQKDWKVEHILQDAGTAGLSEALQTEFGDLLSEGCLKVFIEKDTGMYDAINRGLQRASGDICAYLNCDEQYLPGALTMAASFFRDHPDIDVLFGDFILTDAHGDPISYRRVVMPSLRHLQAAPLGTGSCATFFRRELLRRGFYFDPKLKDVGDAVWVERLLKEKVKMATLPKPLAVFAFTGANRSALPEASKEGAALKAASGFTVRLRRTYLIVAHRIRKALAGAYLRKDIEIEIYTPRSPGVREKRSAPRAGFAWPKA